MKHYGFFFHYICVAGQVAGNHENTKLMNDLEREIEFLLIDQKQDWKLARENYGSLTNVQTRYFQDDYRTTILQFNPERIRSSAAKIDKASLLARPCFFCHRPEEQKGVTYNDAFEILVNPYPIFEDHLTVPLHWHEKQQIKPYYEDMLDIVSDLSDYALFYNGPKCGASAPDHMHFQAGKKEEFPVVRNWPNFPKQVVWESERTGFYASVDLLPVCFILVSRDKGEAAAVFELPKFADGGFTNGPSLAGEAGTEAIISFRRSQREQNIDTWMQAGKMLGVPIASAMIQGSDFGVAFRRTTELANYAADALEGAAASGNATAQKVLDNSRVQQALSFARRADVAQAQLERLSDLDGYDLSNITFFPTAGDAALTRQNLAMLENLRDHQQEVEVPSITGDNGTNSGSGQPGGTGGYQRSYTSSSGNTYVYAPNFIIYGSMNPEDLRSLMDDGYERFCEYVEKYERERKRMDYGT